MRGSDARSSGSSRDVPRGAAGFRDATPSVSTGGLAAVVEAGTAGIGAMIGADAARAGAGAGTCCFVSRSSSYDGLCAFQIAAIAPNETTRPSPATASTLRPRDDTPSSSSASALENVSSRPSSTWIFLRTIGFATTRACASALTFASDFRFDAGTDSVKGGGSSRARALPGGVAVDLRT